MRAAPAVALLSLSATLAACGGGPTERHPAGQEEDLEQAQTQDPEQAGQARTTSPKAEPVEWEGMSHASREERVVFGGQPDPQALERAAREGVGVVVNLRTAPEVEALPYDEEARVEALGMRYESIPIRPDAFGPEEVDRFAEVVREAGEQPVLLHCGTSNRVGGLWAAYLARHRGVPPEEALERGRAAGLRSDSMIEATERVIEAEPAR